jgi:hypothetical protein
MPPAANSERNQPKQAHRRFYMPLIFIGFIAAIAAGAWFLVLSPGSVTEELPAKTGESPGVR